MKDYRWDGMAVYDNHVAFWGGAFSNFYNCKIHVDTDWDGNKVDLNFNCSEQYFMWLKATWFHDYDIAEKILQAKTPKEAKALGRQVEGFEEEEWTEIREAAMWNAVYAKFSQNEDLKTFLLNPDFNGKGFVEGSPIDGIWGVKIHYESPNIDDESQWNGLNLLGKTLDKVRRSLIVGNYEDQVKSANDDITNTQLLGGAIQAAL